MFFQKQHLSQDNYHWAPGNYETPDVPTRKSFDRYNGDQLLHMINCFGTSIGKLSIDDGQKIEALIRTQLPLEVKSEIAVFNWLKGKYLYYWN
ncbi:MAG: hypothetical protein ACTHJ5_19195 [Ilyomonas sp.]